MASGDYRVSDIYQGGYSTLDPKYGDIFGGYRVQPGEFGTTTDPRTANVLQDASTKLNMGIKHIEITGVDAGTFDSMPKQQLKEVNRMAKLLGAEVSLHGPVVDAAGMGQQGFNELNREHSEKTITETLIRGHELNPNGNTTMVFHTSNGTPGSQWKNLGEEGERKAKMLVAVNKETGQVQNLVEEEMYAPDMATGEVVKEDYSPERNLGVANRSAWDERVTKLFFEKERADEIYEQNRVQLLQFQNLMAEKQAKGESLDPKFFTPQQKQAYTKMRDAESYLGEMHKNATTLFNKAYKYGTDQQKEALKQISKDFAKNIKEGGGGFEAQSRAAHQLLLDLQDRRLAPDILVTVEDYATEKAGTTFGNAAFNAFDKINDEKKVPIMCIENPPANFGLSTGEDVKNVVLKSREQFVKRAIEDKGMSEKQAQKLAEKFIGATWDVGHINMLRKFGFDKEDIVKETEKVAPFVKHVHLSDNFGLEHTELPMGMGNVPMKEIMEKLGKEGFSGKKVIEAAQWWQHFRAPPFKETLEAFGSPVYSMNMGPYWNQGVGFQQGYFGGYGMMLPDMNYKTWGAGFSQLPAELGGQQGGAQGSRMSGRGME